MRRPVASLLLVLLLAGFCLPLLEAQPTTPACCRRDGKHHCGTSTTADGFRSLTPGCPYRHLGAITAHADPALGTPAGFSVQVVAAPAPVAASNEYVPRVGLLTPAGRGPPLS